MAPCPQPISWMPHSLRALSKVRLSTTRPLIPSLLLYVGLLVAGIRPASADIFIGQVLPLSGSEANQGRAYALGLQMVLNQVNAAGGVGGQHLTLVSRNESSHDSQSLAATRQLLAEYRPIALTGYFGAANTSSLLASKILIQEKIPLVGYRGADVPKSEAYVYSVRAGLQAQIERIVQHLTTLGIQRIGLVLGTGPQADEVLRQMQDVAGRYGIVLSTTQIGTAPTGLSRAIATDVSVEQAMRKMMATQTQAVIVHAQIVGVPFIEAYRAAGGGAQLITTADIDLERLAQRLSAAELAGISIAQVTPSPTRPTIRLTREFLLAHAANSQTTPGRLQPLDQRMTQRPVSHAMLEGYIAGKVLTEALKRSGRVPTREILIRALDSLNRLDLGDFNITYQPSDHRGSNYVELSIIGSSGKLRQ